MKCYLWLPRPETFFGDDGVMINPNDSRYTFAWQKGSVTFGG